MSMTFETLSLIFQLYSLGELCGLMPEDDIQPTSEQLTMILDFTSGMGIADDIDSGNLIRTFSTYDTNKYFLFVDN